MTAFFMLRGGESIAMSVRYLRFMVDEDFNEPQYSDVDWLLFAFVSK